MQRIEDIKISPDAIGEAGLEKDISVESDLIEIILHDPDIRVTQPIHIHYIVTREKNSENILAHIDVEGELDTICVRCLEPMKYTVAIDLDTDYLPAPPEMDEYLEEERASGKTGYYKKNISLGEYIISEMVLALPMRFVCSSECQGLCPHCGANLNKETCTCEKPIDPRLQKLAVLKEKIRR